MKTVLIVNVVLSVACAPALNIRPDPAVAMPDDCSSIVENEWRQLACRYEKELRARDAEARKAKAVPAPAPGGLMFVGASSIPTFDTGLGLIVTPDRPEPGQTGFTMTSLDREGTVRCFRRNGMPTPVVSRYPNSSIVRIAADLDRDGQPDPTPYVCTTAATVSTLGMEPGDQVDVIFLRPHASKRFAGGSPYFVVKECSRHTFRNHEAGELWRRSGGMAPNCS
ncbi:MAG: hypothetical protein UY77_C0009G0026 [Candidatus Uhrbacteria bacterium GW2011_GWA2_53_10]|uniref:Lipoprotein n=1 Tax=Candidatus Uhrbacteria bacterium GW2011_GWA2_53_10 TaxID=1618980 RepID=A0A0G1XNV6_9BACT|nr:MAG: hypothetical protein UY77_C0009G0026 [Candidatus Uhrbacteria bacterium GW2011_GWA2_53_10]